MYKQSTISKTTIAVNKCYQGETIEAKVRRIVNNKEPIKDGAPLIYTPREKGVMPAYNVRTDRFEIAIDAMDKVTQNHIAKREQRLKPEQEGTETKQGKDGKPESTQATDNK